MKMDAGSDNTDLWSALAKAVLLWGGYLVSQPIGWWAQFVVIVWTCLQAYVLVRDKLWRKNHPPPKD